MGMAILIRIRWKVVSGPRFLAVATSTKSCPANAITPRLTKPRLRLWGMPATSGMTAPEQPNGPEGRCPMGLQERDRRPKPAAREGPRRSRQRRPVPAARRPGAESATGSTTALNRSTGMRVSICVMKSTGFRIGSM